MAYDFYYLFNIVHLVKCDKKIYTCLNIQHLKRDRSKIVRDKRIILIIMQMRNRYQV